jgi:hypothetical protein
MTQRVSWSDRARSDLMNVVKDPALIDQLRDNAEVTLHDVETAALGEGVQDEGVQDGTMWHRGFTHEQERQIKDGQLLDSESASPKVWDFFLFYRRPTWAWVEFEVLGVRSIGQVASWFQRMT